MFLTFWGKDLLDSSTENINFITTLHNFLRPQIHTVIQLLA
jgi:hypothetical protein